MGEMFSQIWPVSIYISICTLIKQGLNLGPHPMGEIKCQNATFFMKGKNHFRYHHYKQNHILNSAQSKA